MSIVVTCTRCRTDYTLPDALLGTSFPCDHCRASVSVDGSAHAAGAVKVGERSDYPAASPLTAQLPPPLSDPPLPDFKLPPRRRTATVVLLVCFGVVLLGCGGLIALSLLDPLAYYRSGAGARRATMAWALPTMTAVRPPPRELSKEPEPGRPKPLVVGDPATPIKNVVVWANYKQMLVGVSEKYAREVLGPPTRINADPADPNVYTEVWEANREFIRLDFTKGRVTARNTSLQPGPNDTPAARFDRPHYEKITRGMTLEAVDELIGSFNSSSGNSDTLEIVRWLDPATPRTITVVFKAGKAVTKHASEKDWGGFEEEKP